MTVFALVALLVGAERPNVVWIVGDDLGCELGCYDYEGVSTSNADRLAAEGTRFILAFATSPVCSPSRTAFQTGRYQTAIGGHHHDTRDKRPLPDSVPTVTGLMRAAGYFVTNGTPDGRRAKSHMNFVYEDETFFDGTDWADRLPGQPFFAQVQIREPHRPFVRSDQPRPEAHIPPYYPEDPLTRADWNDYLASVEAFDRKAGDVLDRLDREGLADNTLVILFGDHGRPHVRGKQWLYDGGLHVPLIIRWPGQVEAGRVDDRLASLIDLMPTTLAAAGVGLPEIEGVAWPGLNLLDASADRDAVFAARDRCGDAVDRVRAVRTRRWKYIRNFMPERSYMQHSGYKRLQYPVDTLMRVLHDRGEWTSPFMAETKPPEELYDLTADPHELRNLAADPSYSDSLAEMRGRLTDWIGRTGDRGAEPESVDMDALLKEKRAYYERGLRKRGLSPDLSDAAYLDWWRTDLNAGR